MSKCLIPGMALIVLLQLPLPTYADADGPGAGFKLGSESSEPVVSPDKSVQIEQYVKTDAEGDSLFQYWAFDAKHKHGHLLNPAETTDSAGYPSDFLFTPDGQWLVRETKLGSGASTLFLYRRVGDRFVPATAKVLGDLAWDFFFSRPEGASIDHDSRYPISGPAMAALATKLRQRDWDENRALVITLSGGDNREVQAWHCLYDLKTATFSVPEEFEATNKVAVKSKK